MTLQLYMTLQIYMCVSWTCMLHYIHYNSVAHNSDVAKMTHEMTHITELVCSCCLMVCMSSCNVVEWWVCSWCSIASPLHGKVCKSSMVLVFTWYCMCMSLLLLYFGMLHVFVHSWKNLLACIPCSSIHETISLHVFLVHHVRHRVMSHPCTYIYNHSR